MKKSTVILFVSLLVSTAASTIFSLILLIAWMFSLKTGRILTVCQYFYCINIFILIINLLVGFKIKNHEDISS